VKIGDGCATVTGYRLPMPLASRSGRRERGFQPEVRIPVWLCSSRFRPCGINFSVKEKDEASLFRECGTGSVNAFILRFVGV
jgi:hypothetical protein